MNITTCNDNLVTNIVYHNPILNTTNCDYYNPNTSTMSCVHHNLVISTINHKNHNQDPSFGPIIELWQLQEVHINTENLASKTVLSVIVLQNFLFRITYKLLDYNKSIWTLILLSLNMKSGFVSFAWLLSAINESITLGDFGLNEIRTRDTAWENLVARYLQRIYLLHDSA